MKNDSKFFSVPRVTTPLHCWNWQPFSLCECWLSSLTRWNNTTQRMQASATSLVQTARHAATEHILVVINGVTAYHFILAGVFALIQRVVFGPVLGICVGAARVFCVSVMNIANAYAGTRAEGAGWRRCAWLGSHPSLSFLQPKSSSDNAPTRRHPSRS